MVAQFVDFHRKLYQQQSATPKLLGVVHLLHMDH
jgi:hypothetical protein